MENYIVRVYRRDVKNTFAVTGVVENVEREEKAVFHSLEELCSILSINPVRTQDEQYLDTIWVGPR